MAMYNLDGPEPEPDSQKVRRYTTCSVPSLKRWNIVREKGGSRWGENNHSWNGGRTVNLCGDMQDVKCRVIH